MGRGKCLKWLITHPRKQLVVRQWFPNSYSTEALTSSGVAGQAWGQAPANDLRQFPSLIGEGGEGFISQKGWLGWPVLVGFPLWE